VYVIGAAGEDGTPRFTLITWITCCGVEPVTLMFSSLNEKETPSSALRTGSFSANLVSAGMVDAADYFGNTSGHHTRKDIDTGVRWALGPATGAPVLENSPWVFECSLVCTKEIAGNTLFFGEVKNILVREDLTETGYGRLDVPLLNPAVYAPPTYYSLGKPIFRVGESLSRFTPPGRPS
jgi:flavin reductase (DIM6/NTAB) family NADH-FMN oxidoreductase RutF